MAYEIDLLNQICSTLGGTTTHTYKINALNEWCTLSGGTGGHTSNIAALNEIDTLAGGTGGHVYDIRALNSIDIALGGTGGFMYDEFVLVSIGSNVNQIVPEFQAVLDAMTTQPSAENITIWNKMVKTMVDSGVWAKLDFFDFFGVHTNDNGEALINWKNPGTHNPTRVNSIPFTAYKGFQGNGTTQYLNSNYNPATQGVNYTANAAIIGVGSQTAGSQAGNEIGASISGSRTEVNCKWNATDSLFMVNTTNNLTYTNTALTGKGHIFGLRKSATMSEFYSNRDYLIQTATAAAGLPNGNYFICARNNGGSADRHSTRQITYALAGAYLTIAEREKMVNAIEEAMAANGAGLYPTPTIASADLSTKKLLPLTTYDGSNQTLHPSVIDSGIGGWNGYRYWMANTPFIDGGGGPAIENPCLFASNDGETWIVPTGVVNPIIAKPATGFNADNDLYFENGVMYVVWVEYTTRSMVYMSSSTDAINWSAKTRIIDSGDGLGDTQIATPSLIKLGATYYIYYHNYTPTGNASIAIKRRSCATIVGNYISPETLTGLSKQQATIPYAWWHLDVAIIESTVWIVLNSYALINGMAGIYIGIAKSSDGLAFNQEPFCPIPISEYYEEMGPYRPSLCVINGTPTVYYGCKSNANLWGTAKVNVNLI